ncbi:MAG TPA: lytic transglycosylase domain-containing protein, partial [Candidatus Binatia bacterium]|nr:lytic transglycosylase domain-containing protein [Candidatus Binatia bacterium]
RGFVAFLVGTLGLAATAGAVEVTVPVRLDAAFIRQAVLSQVFTGPDGTLAWDDGSGCAWIRLAQPTVGLAAGRLRVECAGEARLGKRLGGLCLAPWSWKGSVEVFEEPRLDGRTLRFAVVDSNLYDEGHHKGLTTGVLWDLVKGHVEPRLEAVRIDLEQPFAELRDWLPLVLPGSRERIERLLASLAVRDPRVLPDAVEVTLAFTVEPRPVAATPEPALTPEELRRWQERWQRWDAFLTFVVKRFAGDASGELRQAILAVLLDARYELLEALAPSSPGAPDPVPALFVRTWERLAPVLRHEAAGLPAATALRYTSFITAGDALAALTALGPEVGLDLSADGLRRLARMIDPAAPEDPVAFSEDVDPELRRLFGFGPPLPPPDVPPGVDAPDAPPSGGLGSWLVGTAWAAEGDGLAPWLPAGGDLDAYLARVRAVLERAQADALGDGIAADLGAIHRRLVPATAWQESCWRQFVRARGRIVPLKSAVGSVGIMQVNVHVWRGLYAPRGLHWDVAYNARAGAEILLYYLRDAAHGGRDAPSLVRATYAMYNAGPQARRTRSRGVERVVEALWRKYEALAAEGTRGVAACLGA